MSLRRRVARFNRRVTNPIQRLWAPHLAPWAVVVHRGRASGTTYRTPVTAFVSDKTVTIALPYGEDTDWMRNLTAAGAGELIRSGRTLQLCNFRVVQPGADSLRGLARLGTRLAGIALQADCN